MPTIVDYVTAIGSITTPFALLLLGAIGWIFRSRVERHFALEDNLREDRIETYFKILEPFTIMFAPDSVGQTDTKNRGKDKLQISAKKMLSLEYRQQGFRQVLFGADSVVEAYNNLMQYFFQKAQTSQTPSEEELKDMMSLVGKFLLEIRRSVGNEGTKLDEWQMLEWFLVEARNYRH